MEAMLIGQYEGKIGEKARVAFPKKFREIVGDKLIITLGFEGSLIIVAQEKWESLLEGTEGKPFTTSSAREVQRYLLGCAAFVALDEKGRFILPEHLRSHAKMQEDVVFLGISRYVEMWDKGQWQQYQQGLTKNISSIAEKLTGEDRVPSGTRQGNHE